jgi:hypothetical protein
MPSCSFFLVSCAPNHGAEKHHAASPAALYEAMLASETLSGASGRWSPVFPGSGQGDALGHPVGTDFTGIEFLRSGELGGFGAGAKPGVNRKFGDDAFVYFTERLDPARTRGPRFKWWIKPSATKHFRTAPL